jgi:iron(III) transport system permease protein
MTVDLEKYLIRVGIIVLLCWLLLTIVLPVGFLFIKSFQDSTGAWIWFGNYIQYLSTPGLHHSVWNSFWTASVSTSIVVPLGYIYSYALTRTNIFLKGVFQTVAFIPIFSPSILPAISLIYLFGNQGIFKWMLFDQTIYGPLGIVISQIFYCFPLVVIIMSAALSLGDNRLYESASMLGASRTKTFFTVTLPNIKYGLISACLVTFITCISDYGIPKVIGGSFDTLSIDIVRFVIGQQQFEMAAVVGTLLLVPSILAFFIERQVQKKQVASLVMGASPISKLTHGMQYKMVVSVCVIVGLFILLILGTSIAASLITFWPYNLDITFKHYYFSEYDSSGWMSWANSLKMSFLVSLIGTTIIFVGAYLIERTNEFLYLRSLANFMSMLPMVLPGLVLGVSYIFFFNSADNPLNFIYGTMTILVVNTIAHFYTVGHMTAMTTLKQLDRNFESVSMSLGRSTAKIFFKVIFPISLPTILNVASYLFVVSMTAVSSIIFLYVSEIKVASISIIFLDEAGFIASAAAMSVVVVFTSACVKLAELFLSHKIRTKYS